MKDKGLLCLLEIMLDVSTSYCNAAPQASLIAAPHNLITGKTQSVRHIHNQRVWN